RRGAGRRSRAAGGGDARERSPAAPPPREVVLGLEAEAATVVGHLRVRDREGEEALGRTRVEERRGPRMAAEERRAGARLVPARERDDAAGQLHAAHLRRVGRLEEDRRRRARIGGELARVAAARIGDEDEAGAAVDRREEERRAPRSAPRR